MVSTELVIRIGVVKFASVLLVLGAFGGWLFGEFSRLNNKINEARTDLTDRIQNVRNDLSKNINDVDKRVAKIEGMLEADRKAARRQIAELETKIILSELESAVTSGAPTALESGMLVGTVDSIDLQKRVIAIRDIHDKKIRLAIAHEDALAKVYGAGRIETVYLREIKPGNPVAIGYGTAPTGEKIAIGVSATAYDLQLQTKRTEEIIKKAEMIAKTPETKAALDQAKKLLAEAKESFEQTKTIRHPAEYRTVTRYRTETVTIPAEYRTETRYRTETVTIPAEYRTETRYRTVTIEHPAEYRTEIRYREVDGKRVPYEERVLVEQARTETRRVAYQEQVLAKPARTETRQVAYQERVLVKPERVESRKDYTDEVQKVKKAGARAEEIVAARRPKSSS